MTQKLPVDILSLPDEVIQSILSYLPPAQIPAVQLLSRRFANIAAEPLLWRHFCASSFRWWHKGHKLKERLQKPASTDWRDLYANRHRASRNARTALDQILDNETGRLDQIQKILEAGYDAKEVLLDAFHSAKDSDKYLAQRLG
jgi:F-box protein 21